MMGQVYLTSWVSMFLTNEYVWITNYRLSLEYLTVSFERSYRKRYALYDYEGIQISDIHSYDAQNVTFKGAKKLSWP